MTPVSLERVVKRCLAKDPDERWQSASDLASELNWILASGSQAAVAAPTFVSRKKKERPIWIAGGALLAIIMGYLGWQIGTQGHRTTPVHLAVTLPVGKSLFGKATEPLAISPDGSMIVYSASGDARKLQLYLRKLTDFESKAIPGTEGGQSPFFSPNGEWLGFVTDDAKLKKILLR